MRYTCKLQIFIVLLALILSESVLYAKSDSVDFDQTIQHIVDYLSNDDKTSLKVLQRTHIQLQSNKSSSNDFFISLSEYFIDNNFQEEGLRYFENFDAEDIDDTVIIGELNYFLGKYYNFFGERKLAEKALTSALSQVGSSSYLVMIYKELAELQINVDNNDLAERYLSSGLGLAGKYLHTEKSEIFIHQLYINLYLQRHNQEKVNYHMMKINKLAKLINQADYYIVENLIQTGVYFNTGRWDQGTKELDRITSIEDQSNSKRSIYYFYQGLASIVKTDYDGAIEYFKKSISKTKGISVQHLAMCHAWLGTAYGFLCQHDKATTNLKKAIELYESNPDQFAYQLYLKNSALARYYSEQGDFDKAVQQLQVAKNHRKEDITNLIRVNTELMIANSELLKQSYSPDKMSKLFSIMNETHQYVQEWYYLKNHIFDDQRNRRRDDHVRYFFDSALDIIYHLYNYTQSQMLADRIVNYSCSMQSMIYSNNNIKFDPFQSSSVSDVLIRQELDLRNSISSIKKEYNQCKELHENLNIDSKLFYLDSLQYLREEHSKIVVSQLPNQRTLFYDLEKSGSIMHDIQNQLTADEAIINYYQGTGYLYSTVITKEVVSFFRKEIDDRKRNIVNIYKEEVSNPDLTNRSCYESSLNLFAETSHEIYEYLLGDEINTFESSVKHIYVISDWLLESLPFKTLLTSIPHEESNFKDMPYLLRDYTVVYDYSLQSLLSNKIRKRKVRENSYVGFSPDYKQAEEFENSSLVMSTDPNDSTLDLFVSRGGLTNLPGAKRGVIEISKKVEDAIAVTGVNANKKNFNKYTGKSDILQLAMHAVIDSEEPELSQFLFSGLHEDQNLFAYELSQIKVDTEIAMLSGCDTGRGGAQSGKSIQSISQAFSFSGSSSLTMSFYKIPDEQTAIIDNGFIESVVKGVRLDESLRQSNLNYLETVSEKYLHPFYWSGIVVAGKTCPLKVRNPVRRSLKYLTGLIN